MKSGNRIHETINQGKGQLNRSIEFYLLCRLYKAVTSCQKEVQDFLTPSSATVPEGTNAHDSDIKIWDYVLTFEVWKCIKLKEPKFNQKIKLCAGNYINAADNPDSHHPFDFASPLYLC